MQAQRWQLGRPTRVRVSDTAYSYYQDGKVDGVTRDSPEEGELWLRPGWRHVCRSDWAEIQIKTFLETIQRKAPVHTIIVGWEDVSCTTQGRFCTWKCQIQRLYFELWTTLPHPTSQMPWDYQVCLKIGLKVGGFFLKNLKSSEQNFICWHLGFSINGCSWLDHSKVKPASLSRSSLIHAY